MAVEEEEGGDEAKREEVFVPSPPELPEAPRLKKISPLPLPGQPRPGSAANAPVPAGRYKKMAYALSLVSSFTTPLVVLTIGGYLLDRKLGHTQDYFALGGVLLGLIVGTISAGTILKKILR